MKRVLISGGSGFIGHHIIEHILKHTDWEIVSMDRLSVSGNYNRLSDLDCWGEEYGRVSFVHHDLRSAVNAQVASRIGEIDYILHLAASTHVDRSIEDPMSFVLDNVVATTNMLEFARAQEHLKSFLYFSTDEVFGPAPEGTSYKEWDRYNSGNPYAAAKAGGEEMALAFSNTYNIPLIITHTMNVFGERQHPEKYIPMTIKKILNGEKIIIHANKEKTKAGSRFWIHGRNVAAALTYILEMGEKEPADLEKVVGDIESLGFDTAYFGPEANGAGKSFKFNIVGEQEFDNLEMAQFIYDTVMDITKPDEPRPAIVPHEMVDFHSSRPGHDLRYALDGAKLKALGWEPPVGFKDSLRRVVEWTIKNPKWLD